MTTKTYATTVYVTVAKQILVKANNRAEAIEKASKIAERRYGDQCTGTLSVPYLEGDE